MVDAIVHIVGLGFGLAASTVLAMTALSSGDGLRRLGLGLYAAGLLAMLGCSALYNMTGHSSRKEVFRRLDHAAIFVMIAGTYSPFALIVMGGATGVALFAAVWLAAAGGVLLKLLWSRRFERLSIALYLLLGWSVLVVLDRLTAIMSFPGLVLLGAGGVLYTVGVGFHLWSRLPYHNAVWHAFVLLAATCHFAAVLIEVAIIG